MTTSALPPMPAHNHRRLVGKLMLIVAASFAFGFALVPLYDVFCRLTGLNGKTAGPGGVQTVNGAVSPIDRDRVVTVEFTGTVMPGLAWEVEPVLTRLDLHPGELHQARYRVRNLSDTSIVGQAVPSVSPGQAALNFEKLDCFCFRQQTLAPGETKELPLTFIVKPELDRDVRTITLSYAFFDLAGAAPAKPSRDAP
ncbi:MAG: cytochrome c oxidase assembly protein [Propionivibrio sp.]